MNFREKAFSALRWVAGVRVATQVFTWLVTLLVIRLLSPADYGLLAMATVVTTLLSIVSDVGLVSAVVQRSDIRPGVMAQIFGVALLINAAICALLLICAPLIGELYKEPRVVPVIQVLSLQFILSSFAVVPDALLQRAMEFKQRSLLDLGGSMLSSTLTLALAYGGFGVWSLVAGSLAGQLARIVGLNIIVGRWQKPVFSFVGLGEYVRFGGHLSLSTLFWFIFTQADIFIAGRWLGKEALGHYSVAMHLASLFNQRLAGVINQIAFPAFAHIQHDRRQVAEKVLMGSRVLAFFAFPCLWGLSAVAPEIVRLLLGDRWLPAILPLSILALIMPLRVIGNFMPNALQGIGRSDIVVKNAFWACVIMPTAYIIGIRWGLVGLSYAWLIGAPLLFIDNTRRSVRALGISFRHVIKALMPAALPAALMYALVASCRELVQPSLLLLVPVGILAYGAGALAFNASGCTEVRSLIKGIAMPNKAAQS